MVVVSVEQKTASLTLTESETIEYLLLNKKGCRWGISDAINRSYSGVWKGINKLLKHGLIQEIEKIPSTRNPSIEKSIYSLTDRGFYSATRYKSFWENIELVAQNYRDKLKIFKLWPKFKEAGLIEMVYDTMRYWVSVNIQVDSNSVIKYEDIWIQDFDISVIMLVCQKLYFNSESDLNKVIKILEGDQEFLMNLTKRLEGFIDVKKKDLRFYEGLKKILV